MILHNNIIEVTIKFQDNKIHFILYACFINTEQNVQIKLAKVDVSIETLETIFMGRNTDQQFCKHFSLCD